MKKSDVKTHSLRVHLCGGLGNQLFQYAFGRVVAEHLNLKLKLDIGTGFARDFVYKRHYELDVFELNDQTELIRPSKFAMQLQRLKLALALRKWAFTGNYLIEPSDGQYLPDAIQGETGKSYTCFGYWQDERYFSKIENTLRKELSFKRQLSGPNQIMAQQLESENSVAVHIRRLQYDCALGIDYYDREIKHILNLIPDAKLYCFTDDPEWCLEKLLPKYKMTLIQNKNLPAIEDFQLMSHCRHFITANSSFSWWAAWLGRAKEKLIIRPTS
ncbi:alpha-1,2-fucosyltransferase [bacterium]|nr:alpha-1,2-fucosyltransferase [bacterium]